MKKPILLVVDDDTNTRQGLELALKEKYDVRLAESADAALKILLETSVDAMLSDIRMPGMDGLSLLQRALARSPQPVCILMTAYGSIDKAVEAIKRGAADYVTKPYNLDDLEMRLDRALRSRTIEFENARLLDELDRRYGLENIIGNSPSMLKVCELIKQAAPTQATVLVRGESGTGKEIVAHAIHQLSSRSKGPFIAVHCAALSQTLMESELFGHEKGAFTGANERRVGRFEQADGGTLFMDEVSEIPPSAQTKLLRVLEERCFERVGGSKTVEVDIRLISATNKNLKSLTDSGAFRSDLYFRMNVVDIDLPPLREHMEDLPLLCRHFLNELSRDNNKHIEDVSPEVLNVFSGYSWPGNVRELRNAIERMIVFSRGSKLTARDIPPEIREAAGKGHAAGPWPAKGAAPVSMEEAEKMMIVRALEQNDDNRTKAAIQLGISRRTFHRKLKQFHLEDMK